MGPEMPVGHRLALQALRYEYGFDLLCEPPCAESIERDGDRLILRFREVGDGLSLQGRLSRMVAAAV